MTPVTERASDAAVDEVLGRYPAQPSSLISVLEDLQEELHYLPEAVLNRVAAELQVPRAQVYHVATFYKGFSLQLRGKHIMSICAGGGCRVKGSGRLAELLEQELHIADGETTSDGLFTLQSVRCLGCCSLAPAIMIDREVHGGVTATALRRILKQYRKGEA